MKDNVMDHSLLGRLASNDRDCLIGMMTTRTVDDGADIVTQGDSTTDCFFLLEGQAIATVYAEDGRMVLLRDIGPGSIFGEFAALDGGPRTADVVARGPVRVGRMSRETLYEAIERAPGVGRLLLSHLVGVIRSLSDRIDEQTTMHVRERLLRELMRLSRSVSRDADRAMLRPSPTHAVMAANIGTHREAVTKLLSAFAKKGLVQKISGGLLVPSVEALEREAARGHE